MGEEKDKGKLLIMRRNNVGLTKTAPNGAITWSKTSKDAGY